MRAAPDTEGVATETGSVDTAAAPESESWRERPTSHLPVGMIMVIVTRLLLLVVILAIWEWASGPKDDPSAWIDEFYISKPSAIWDALYGWIEQGLLWPAVLATLRVTLYGFFVGAVGGLAVGFLLGVNRFLARVLQPYVTALYSVPRLALVPLFMLWFGLGDFSKVALIASVVFFLVFYSTYAGVRDVDHEVIDKMRLMRANRWDVHMKATLPSAMSHIIAGLSISGPYALVVAVTAEMLSSNEGTGYLLIRASNQYDTPGVFAAIVVMMVIGILLMGSIQLVEKRLLRWKPRPARRR